MSNTYTWLVDSLDVMQTPNPNTVTAVHWRVRGDDGAGHTAETYNVAYLDPPGQTFTAYADLTLATIVAWLQAKLGTDQVAAVERALDSMIADKAAPVVTARPLPWQ